MGRRSKYITEVNRLLDMGFSVSQIVKLTGIPKTTVHHCKNKLVRASRFDFERLLDGEYLYAYMRTMEDYQRTIQQCNERLAELQAKYNKLENDIYAELETTTSKLARATLLKTLAGLASQYTNDLTALLALRDRAVEAKAKTLNQGPYVRAVEQMLQTGQKSLPYIKEVDDIVAQRQLPENSTVNDQSAVIILDQTKKIDYQPEDDPELQNTYL
jgi:hypothetical protein